MSISLSATRFHRRPLAAFVAVIAFAGIAAADAQTVFTANGIAGAVSGASTNVAATNSDALYNNFGSTTNNLTAVTFGNGFSMTATGPDSGAYDNTFIIGGTISGDSIAPGTTLGISYDFTLTKNAYVSGDANWTLKFSDSVNNPSGNVGSASVVASGTLSSLTDVFTGSGSYNFVSGVGAGDTFRVFVEVTFTGALAIMPPTVTGTMSNTGYGGGGITLGASAVPEPSTYAALAGVAVLVFAVWRRRRTTLVGLQRS